MIRRPIPILAFMLLGCGSGPGVPASTDLAALDRELAADDLRDPVLMAALADQIMVDPALVQSAGAHAIRPADQPQSAGTMPPPPLGDPLAAAALPPAPSPVAGCADCAARRGTLTIGALAARQRHPRTAACAATLGYSTAWSTQLPLPPTALVREAAGSDVPGCRLRVVAFATAAAPARTIAFYHARARAAGYAADVQADGDTRVVRGTRGGDAFVIYADRRGDGGSDVQMVVEGG